MTVVTVLIAWIVLSIVMAGTFALGASIAYRRAFEEGRAEGRRDDLASGQAHDGAGLDALGIEIVLDDHAGNEDRRVFTGRRVRPH